RSLDRPKVRLKSRLRAKENGRRDIGVSRNCKGGQIMALVSWRGFSPFAGLLELQDALGQALENPGLGLGRGLSAPSVFPPLNVFTDEDGGGVLRAEMRGIAPDGVQSEVEPMRLTISGERTPDRSGNGYHRRERRFGRFSRWGPLPPALRPEPAT